MRQVRGTESIFYIKHEGIWCPVACETSSGMSEQTEMISTTTRDNEGWRTEKPTLQGYSISVSGALVNELPSPEEQKILSYFKLRQKKRNRELIEWKRETLGGRYIDSGRAYITDISDENPVDDMMTFTMTLSGFGKPDFVADDSVIVAEAFANYNDDLVANSNNQILEP